MLLARAVWHVVPGPIHLNLLHDPFRGVSRYPGRIVSP
ncbi:hypothetical protein APASM_0611 [Actinosynnema pretiosum subsp. pretiosum]|nr:hypothetical protein APASM_0611 [Actinosynnema pretiosum subsp. pretiosum]